MRKLAFALGFVALAAACSDPLDVQNPNQPDIPRTLARAADIETLIGGTYRNVHVATLHSNDGLYSQLTVMALESYASVNNFGMNVRAPIPRTAIQNSVGNNVAAGNLRDYRLLQIEARSVANYIAALDALQAQTPTSPILGGNAGRTNAARAFGFFTLGLAHGYAAMAYDSAATVFPATPVETRPLEHYTAVMTHALAMMDSALAIATSAASVADNATFLIPSEWLPANTATPVGNRAQFIQLVRSYKARLRAGVARTAAERAAADWPAIIADAENGLPNGLSLNLATATGWDHAWIANQYRYTGWHNMANHFIGMADTSGAYEAWLNQPNASKQPFLIRTPDLRFPAGETRAAQQAASTTPPTGRQYFRNRPTGEDTPTPAHGDGWYDHSRFYGIFVAPGRVGVWPTMSRTELDMLRAEGHIRGGNPNAAIPLINLTRTTSGLPAIPLGATVVPGGAACVPQVPTGPNGTTTTCGSIMEAMKYEKRLETQITGYGQWFFDARGWGDLPENTALHWPVPYQEMESRLAPFKTEMGGPGATQCTGGATPPACESAPRSTYGAW